MSGTEGTAADEHFRFIVLLSQCVVRMEGTLPCTRNSSAALCKAILDPGPSTDSVVFHSARAFRVASEESTSESFGT